MRCDVSASIPGVNRIVECNSTGVFCQLHCT